MVRIALIALGGNALMKKGEESSIANQFRNANKALACIIPLLKKGYSAVITHGNGPQVGNIMLRTEAAKRKAYQLPLDVCDAQSQGEIGYIIQQSLANILAKHKIKKNVVSVITQVEVDKDDPAFKKPTKPVGPFYSRLSYFSMRKRFPMVYDAGRGYRRVVASPKPIKIVESEAVKQLIYDNSIVIAAGGGGIPVVKTKNGYEGIDAVIDKDRASACLARQIGAELFINVTGVDKVALDFGTRNQSWLRRLSLRQAKAYLKQNQFPDGSMGPKIEAAIDFLINGGKKYIITSPAKVGQALDDKDGTVIR